LAKIIGEGFSPHGQFYEDEISYFGLGLALVSQVVERHGGQLTAEVTYGSVVSVTIERGAAQRRRS